MNKKGQTLIFFVLLIPIFVTLMAVIVDVGVMRYTYQNTKSIVSDGIRMYLKDKDITTLKEVLEDNGLEKEEYVIKEEDAKVLVTVHTKAEAIFGQIIGFSSYDIDISLVGFEENEEIIIRKEEVS